MQLLRRMIFIGTCIHCLHIRPTVIDDMFGVRLGLVYGIKMVAHALKKPFIFTCGLAERETSIGASYLMELNSAKANAPVLDQKG